MGKTVKDLIYEEKRRVVSRPFERVNYTEVMLFRFLLTGKKPKLVYQYIYFYIGFHFAAELTVSSEPYNLIGPTDHPSRTSLGKER